MNVSLTPELEKFIENKLHSRMYQTASEVVREALRRMVEQEQERQARLEALRREVRVGLDELDRGQHADIRNRQDRDALLERIKRRGRGRLAARKKGPPA